MFPGPVLTTCAPFQLQNARSRRGRAGAAAGSKSRGGPAADKDGVDRSWRRSIGERIIDSVGCFTSAAVSARKRDLDLAREERGAHEQVQIEKGDGQSSKEARIGGRECQDAATRVLPFALSRGRPKNCRGCLLAALSEKGQTAEGEGSEAFKGELQRQAPLSTTMGMPLLQVPAALFACQASAFPALHLLSTASSEDHEEVGTLGVHKGGGGVGSASAG